MDEDYDTTDEDHHTTDEDHHTMDENHHATDEEQRTMDGDNHTTDEEFRTTEEEEYVNMETSEYRVSGPGALLRNTLKGPGMKMVEWRAKSGERLGVTRAIMQEKFSRAGASINYHVYSITHPIHPMRRKAAKEAATQKKSLASDRRTQREAAAHSNAAAKIAAAREGRIATLEEGVH